MRIPLATNLESRDGTLDQDAIVKNGYAENTGELLSLFKRFGTTALGTVTASGSTQGISWWDYQGLALVVKNNKVYRVDPASFSSTEITLSAGSGISGDNRVDILPLVTNGPAASNSAFIRASNSIWSVNAAWGGASYSYTYSEGTDRWTTSVPGLVMLDGYLFVMTNTGQVFNSAYDNYTFSASDYLTCDKEPSQGRGIGKVGSYILGFKEWSTTALYNAGNPTGSVLSPVSGGFSSIGCADGWSIAALGDVLFWMGQTREAGRSIYMTNGLEHRQVSTQDIDRVLAADSLAGVYAYAAKVGGHRYYVLSLTNSAITLVYDADSGVWSTWSLLEASSNKSVSSITRSDTTATVTTSTAHGLSDGDPVTIAGADQAGYNGLFQIAYVSSTVFTIEVDSGTTSPATGTITATPYTETYYKFTHYAFCSGVHFVMHLTDGDAYKLDSSVYKDDGIPINFFALTPRLDGGTTGRKKLSRIAVVGDDVSDTAMVRWSDDDSGTFSAYRRVTLSDDVPELRRCGAFERRSIEFRHIGNTAPSVDALELEIGR